MRKILDKKLPFHLDELRFMNLQITGKISYDLVKEIHVKNQITKLALVHIKLSDEAFNLLIEAIRKSSCLRVLDLSWCERNYEDFLPFYEMLAENRKLVSINLCCNSLFDYRTKQDGSLSDDA